MKVLDLLCAQDHAFEGWFASEDDYQSQHARGLVQCPLCGSADIRKGLSAPRLNLRVWTDEPAAKAAAPASQAPAHAVGGVDAKALHAAWLQMARQIMQQTEDVGGRFAAEARRMHYGEIEERGIRGQATVRETAELLEEGIPVLPLLVPESTKETLQ